MDYRQSLDGMRGVAVTTVVAYHVCSFQRNGALPGGWGGVDVFFVLSGFLISTILLEELSRTDRLDLRDFYFRRLVRLAPALMVLLLVLACVAASIGRGFGDILYALVYLMNWARAFSWSADQGGFLGHTWSLSVEEQFYLIWPAVLLILVRVRGLAPLIIAAMAALGLVWRCWLVSHGAHYQRTYNGFDTHADPILIGCLLAFVPGLIRAYSGLASRLAIIPVLTMAVFVLKMHIYSRYGESVGVTIAALCSAWMLVATFTDGLLTRALSVRPLVYTGRISYGWYLWHYPILFVMNRTQPEPLAVNLALALLGYAVAAASFHWVERPISLRFKHALTGRRVRPTLAPEPRTAP